MAEVKLREPDQYEEAKEEQEPFFTIRENRVSFDFYSMDLPEIKLKKSAQEQINKLLGINQIGEVSRRAFWKYECENRQQAEEYAERLKPIFADKSNWILVIPDKLFKELYTERASNQYKFPNGIGEVDVFVKEKAGELPDVEKVKDLDIYKMQR
jgi:hypothetical protein